MGVMPTLPSFPPAAIAQLAERVFIRLLVGLPRAGTRLQVRILLAAFINSKKGERRMKYLRLAEILDDVTPEESLDFERLLFNGGENHIKIQKGVERVTIETCLKNSDYVMELFMATDAIRRLGAKQINLLMPYVPYARQDRVMVFGEPLSIKVFTDIINAQGYDNVYTLDNHSSVTTALLKNCREISTDRIMSELLVGGVCLVSPDAGATKKTLQIAAGVERIVQCSKVRNPIDGTILHTAVHCDDLQGQDCYIVDDICDGGRTFVEIAKVLKTKNPGKITLYVSHGIFSRGVSCFEGLIDEIATTIPFNKRTVKRDKIRVIPLKKGDLE